MSADNTLANTGNTSITCLVTQMDQMELDPKILRQSSTALDSEPCAKHHATFIFFSICFLLYQQISACNILAIDNSIYLVGALHISYNDSLISPV